MSRTVLDYEAAHTFVEQQSRKGNDVRWEGWDMVFFSVTPWGFSHEKGAFRNGRWGMELRINPAENGTWSVPKQHVRGTR